LKGNSGPGEGIGEGEGLSVYKSYFNYSQHFPKEKVVRAI